MPIKKDRRAAPGRAAQTQQDPRAPKRRQAVRAIAHGALLAAGIAAARLATPEMDPRFEMFDRTLVDRLEQPITRYHE
jgi:ferric-dicitrate binding protein FerR (iron transport regulator)